MFDFLDSDWFIIVLEIAFLIFIAYDIKKYVETKKNEYIINVVFTFVFFIWAAIPFYNKYVAWDDVSKASYTKECLKDNNETLCPCVTDAVFKEYSLNAYNFTDKNSTDYKNFLKESKEDCLDDSWF